MDVEVSEQEAERNHWIDVMRTLETYEDLVGLELERRQSHLNRLPKVYADRLPSATFDKLAAIQDASITNQAFLSEAVFYHCRGFYKHSSPEDKFPGKYKSSEQHGIPAHQQHRNEAVLHSLFREWSEQGKVERSQSFEPIVNELKRLLPVTRSNVYKQRVLVPGSGLARLPLEITAAGYAAQGNEFSAYMAIPSNFILNAITETNCFTIHPWLDKVCNVVSASDVLAPVMIPDVTAGDMLLREVEYSVDELPSDGPEACAESVDAARGSSRDAPTAFEEDSFPRFSMCLGDFVDIYGAEDNKSFWHGIATCFFIDTAPVVVDYIDVIYHLLRPGGVWVNQGPLLYHWMADIEGNQDARYSKSIELSWEELRQVIVSYGFEFITEEWKECVYANCPSSMMWNTYRTVFFSVRKPMIE